MLAVIFRVLCIIENEFYMFSVVTFIKMANDYL